MFDTKIHHHESKAISVTKETEKTISPDKVTEMYDKVRDEVENQFVKAFRIDTDIINGVVVELSIKPQELERVVYSRFILNDKEYIFKDEIKCTDVLSNEQLFDVFRKHYESEISRQIMAVVVKKISKNKKFIY